MDLPAAPRTLLDFHLKLPSLSAYPKGRYSCAVCSKEHMYCCPDHYVPTAGDYSIPTVSLPLHCHILRGQDEKASKSTSSHILSLAPGQSSLSLLPSRAKHPHKRQRAGDSVELVADTAMLVAPPAIVLGSGGSGKKPRLEEYSSEGAGSGRVVAEVCREASSAAALIPAEKHHEHLLALPTLLHTSPSASTASSDYAASMDQPVMSVSPQSVSVPPRVSVPPVAKGPLDTLFADPKRVLVLFPSPTSKLASELTDLDAYDTVIAVDTTWHKTGATIAAMQLAELPFQHVRIASYHTLFWRYQPLGPQCLSTLEAVYYFCREFAVEKQRRALLASPLSTYRITVKPWQCEDSRPWDALEERTVELMREEVAALSASDPDNLLYRGEFDGLLLFFLVNYKRIQFEYTQGRVAQAGKTFTRRMRNGYIQGDHPPGRDEVGAADLPKQGFRGSWAVDPSMLDEGALTVLYGSKNAAQHGYAAPDSIAAPSTPAPDADAFVKLAQRVRLEQEKDAATSRSTPKP